eukprot:365064-Chlamydomonas_euryale.AAC.4
MCGGSPPLGGGRTGPGPPPPPGAMGGIMPIRPPGIGGGGPVSGGIRCGIRSPRGGGGSGSGSMPGPLGPPGPPPPGPPVETTTCGSPGRAPGCGIGGSMPTCGITIAGMPSIGGGGSGRPPPLSAGCPGAACSCTCSCRCCASRCLRAAMPLSSTPASLHGRLRSSARRREGCVERKGKNVWREKGRVCGEKREGCVERKGNGVGGCRSREWELRLKNTGGGYRGRCWPMTCRMYPRKDGLDKHPS